MSSYTFNGYSISPPPGSIITYVGKTDPSGWIICNGVTRTSTDSRYVNIYQLLNTYLGVSSNTANSITPPNLKNSFLYGSDNDATMSYVTGGSSSVTLAENQMPLHNHAITITEVAHNHGITGSVTYGTTNSTPGSGSTSLSTNNFNATSATLNNTLGTANAKTNLTATSANRGGTTAVGILPPYVTINYIMKF